MQVAAALPTVALLAGSAFGLLVPSIPLSIGFAILGLASAAAIWSWRESHVWPLAVSVGIAFFAGGALLAVDAWQRAWRPPLRGAFEELARTQREEAAATGRPRPEDARALAI